MIAIIRQRVKRRPTQNVTNEHALVRSKVECDRVGCVAGDREHIEHVIGALVSHVIERNNVTIAQPPIDGEGLDLSAVVCECQAVDLNVAAECLVGPTHIDTETA